jgi:hypothetical protein
MHTVQRRRQENIAAKQQQEEQMRVQVEAKLKAAARKQAALQLQRQLEQEALQTSKAKLTKAAMHATRHRAELVEEERRRQYAAKAALLEDKLRRVAEEQRAAEVRYGGDYDRAMWLLCFIQPFHEQGKVSTSRTEACTQKGYGRSFALCAQAEPCILGA